MSDSKSVRECVARHVSVLPRSGIRDFFDIVSEMDDVISLGIGEPDFDTPWHVREAAIFALERGATHYTSNLGLPRLRQTLAGYVASAFDVRYEALKAMLVTVGVSEALDLAVRALVNPGDEVLYHEPCYVSYRPLIELAHGVPVALPTSAQRDFRLTRADIEPHLTERSRLLLLNYPNNPTGAVLTREDAEGIAALAVERDLIVVTDEIYAELSYDEPHVSLAALPGMRERTVLLHGMSKAWAMTGFRIGYACAPAWLIEAMMKIHQYTMLCAPILSQEAAIEAARNATEDIDAMRAEYRRRRNFLLSCFRDMALPCSAPRGAFYAFPRTAELGISEHDFAMGLLEKKKVACVPGTAFGPSGEGHVRCSYATGMDDLKEAMRRMGEYVTELRQARSS